LTEKAHAKRQHARHDESFGRRRLVCSRDTLRATATEAASVHHKDNDDDDTEGDTSK
jgi:hypothetical protein